MAKILNEPKEAFVAIAAVVLAADKVGSFAERDYLVEQLKGVDLFKQISTTELKKLLSDVTERIYNKLPVEDHCLTCEGVTQLLESAQPLLNANQRKTIYQIVCGLATVDDRNEAETGLLEQIRHGLGV